jgi:molybdate transport system ATP-binding protein
VTDAADATGPVVSDTGLDVAIRMRLSTFTLDVQLAAARGVLVLFGPSGAGKSTVLNAIAGLSIPDAGRISMDGRVLFDGDPAHTVPARLRRIGYVMQDYALFPHMTALENVMYPLRRDPDRVRTATALLDRLGIAAFAAVKPDRLSGGQQQRVAMARALALRTPVLLLDEPFGALDTAVREQLQEDLRALQRDLGLLMLLVTHRVEDVFALGDSMIVLDEGRVLQAGAVADVFRAPASRRVAALLGVRNVIEARVVRAGPDAVLDWYGLPLQTGLTLADDDASVAVFVRPEDIKVVYPDRALGPAVSSNLFTARITMVRPHASMRVVTVRLENDRLLEVRFPELSYLPLRLEAGESIRIALRREAFVHIETISSAAGTAVALTSTR